MSAKILIHTADIHIGSGPRSQEYRAVFDQLFSFISKYPGQREDIIVVIAGDIFHHKTRYAPEDVDDFNYLCDGFSNLGVTIILIPGNHDANLSGVNLDLITPLIPSRKNVHYLHNTGYFNIRGVKFYHHSVFDKGGITVGSSVDSGAGSSKTEDTILLYHGIVDGVTFGKHVENGTRVSRELMSSFYLCLFGDVHEHSFITPTAAYPGSLIQQNLGESSVKGFIVWSIAERTGKFVRLNNERGFLRLDLRGKSREECIAELGNAPKDLIKVSVVVDDTPATKELVATVQNHCGRIDRVTTISSAGVFTPAEDLVENLSRYLTGKTDPDLLKKVCELYSTKVSTHEFKRWTVRKMIFSNLFRYGPGNVIDFTKIHGVSGVIAPNRAGKSSIIDILVFGLFNEHLRADNKSMIHHGAKSASLRIDFACNGIEYYVERTIDSKKHSKCSLFMNVGSNLDSTKSENTDSVKSENSQWKNITAESVTATYSLIAKIIGSLDRFLATGLYYDSATDLFKMKKAERMRILPELFGIIDNEGLVKELGAKVKEINSQISALTKHRYDPTEEIAATEAKIAAVKSELERVSAENTAVEEEYRSLSIPKRSYDEVRSELLCLEKQRDELTSSIASLHIKTADPAEKVVLSGDEINRLKVIISRPVINVEDLPGRIAALEFRLSQYGNVNIDEAKLAGVINAAEQKLERLRPFVAEVKPADYELLEQYQTECGKIALALKGINIIPQDPRYIQKMEGEVAKYSQESLKFNGECQCCNNNMQYIARARYDLEAELSSARLNYARTEEENKVLRAREAELCKKRDELTAKIDSICRYDSAVAKKVQSEAEMSKLVSDIERGKKALADIRSAKTVGGELSSLRRTLGEQREIEGARAKLDAAKKYAAYSEYIIAKERYDSISAKLRDIEQRIFATSRELADVEKAGDVVARYAELRKLLAEQKASILKLTSELSGLQERMTVHIAERDLMVKYNAEFPPLSNTLGVYKLLADSLKSPELKLSIIKSKVISLCDAANSVLEIAGFKIIPEVSDKEIDFYIEDIGGSHKFPAQLASGYQKFFCAIAIRLALGSLAQSCNFIVIDEGFSAADQSNLQSIIDNFPLITANLDFAFIISHIPELNSMLERPIYLQCGDNTTYCSNVTLLVNPVGSVNSVGSVSTVSTVSTVSELLPGVAPAERRPRPVRPKGAAKEAVAPVTKQDLQPVISNDVQLAVEMTAQPDKIMCACGAIVNRKGKSAHEKTAKHKAALDRTV